MIGPFTLKEEEILCRVTGDRGGEDTGPVFN